MEKFAEVQTLTLCVRPVQQAAINKLLIMVLHQGLTFNLTVSIWCQSVLEHFISHLQLMISLCQTLHRRQGHRVHSRHVKKYPRDARSRDYVYSNAYNQIIVTTFEHILLTEPAFRMPSSIATESMSTPVRLGRLTHANAAFCLCRKQLLVQRKPVSTRMFIVFMWTVNCSYRKCWHPGTSFTIIINRQVPVAERGRVSCIEGRKKDPQSISLLRFCFFTQPTLCIY